MASVSTDGPPAVHCRGLVDTTDYPAGSTFGPRRVPDYEFVWVLQGSAYVTVDLADATAVAAPAADRRLRLPLTPGQLLLSRSGTIDYYQWAPSRLSSHAWVHFTSDDLSRLPPPDEWPLTRSTVDNPVLAGLCDYLIDLSARPSAAARARTDQLVGVLLDLFVTGPLADAGPRLPVHVDAAADWVRRRWHDRGVTIVDTEDLASAAGISAGHLFRVFRTEYGCGPAHALELIRLSRAATALQRSNAPLAAIADQTGFANAYHFSRRFSLAYGLPPGAYRRQGAGADPYDPLDPAGLRRLARAVSA